MDKLLQYVDLGEFKIVESHTNRQDMLEQVLGVVLAAVDDPLSRSGKAHQWCEMFGTVFGD